MQFKGTMLYHFIFLWLYSTISVDPHLKTLLQIWVCLTGNTSTMFLLYDWCQMKRVSMFRYSFTHVTWLNISSKPRRYNFSRNDENELHIFEKSTLKCSWICLTTFLFRVKLTKWTKFWRKNLESMSQMRQIYSQ